MKRLIIDDAFLKEKRFITTADIDKLEISLWRGYEFDIDRDEDIFFAKVSIEGIKGPITGWYMQILYGGSLVHKGIYVHGSGEIIKILPEEVISITKLQHQQVLSNAC